MFLSRGECAFRKPLVKLKNFFNLFCENASVKNKELQKTVHFLKSKIWCAACQSLNLQSVRNWFSFGHALVDRLVDLVSFLFIAVTSENLLFILCTFGFLGTAEPLKIAIFVSDLSNSQVNFSNFACCILGYNRQLNAMAKAQMVFWTTGALLWKTLRKTLPFCIGNVFCSLCRSKL